MPGIGQLIEGIERNAARITTYSLGGDGTKGKCDCVGLIIGAMRLIGMGYTGIHGSNYFARYRTESLAKISKAADLQIGQVVYKARTKDDSAYALPSRYAADPDQRDYYHIGIVMSVNPLKIAHCSVGGMNYDSKLGKWSYAGFIRNVDYGAQQPEHYVINPGMAYVDVPNDGTVNVRASPKSNAKIQDKLREGTDVEVLALTGDWALVEYKVQGYIKNEFLRGRDNDMG